ncbi:hypothetical protein ACFLSJ_04825 [Verrucomicrobiota bacterium]
MRKIKVLATVVVLICLVACGVNATAFFSLDQNWRFYSSSWSFSGMYNFNSNRYLTSGDNYGNYELWWELPYGAWYGFYIYDYSTGTWEEAVYLYDENW